MIGVVLNFFSGTIIIIIITKIIINSITYSALKFMPRIILVTLYVFLFNYHTVLPQGVNPHFIYEETKTQRSFIAYPASHSKRVTTQT